MIKKLRRFYIAIVHSGKLIFCHNIFFFCNANYITQKIEPNLTPSNVNIFANIYPILTNEVSFLGVFMLYLISNYILS